MKLVICGPNLRTLGSETFHVHRAGCGDLRKYTYTGEPPMEVDTSSKVEVCDFVYGVGEFETLSGAYLYDFKFFPCAGDLPLGEPQGVVDDAGEVTGPFPTISEAEQYRDQRHPGAVVRAYSYVDTDTREAK